MVKGSGKLMVQGEWLMDNGSWFRETNGSGFRETNGSGLMVQGSG